MIYYKYLVIIALVLLCREDEGWYYNQSGLL